MLPTVVDVHRLAVHAEDQRLDAWRMPRLAAPNVHNHPAGFAHHLRDTFLLFILLPEGEYIIRKKWITL